MDRTEPTVNEGVNVPPHWLAIEQQVRAIPQEELKAFLAWLEVVLADIDWELWDREIEEDAAAGRLGPFEKMAEEALREYREGKTTPL